MAVIKEEKGCLDECVASSSLWYSQKHFHFGAFESYVNRPATNKGPSSGWFSLGFSSGCRYPGTGGGRGRSSVGFDSLWELLPWVCRNVSPWNGCSGSGSRRVLAEYGRGGRLIDVAECRVEDLEAREYAEDARVNGRSDARVCGRCIWSSEMDSPSYWASFSQSWVHGNCGGGLHFMKFKIWWLVFKMSNRVIEIRTSQPGYLTAWIYWVPHSLDTSHGYLTFVDTSQPGSTNGIQ